MYFLMPITDVNGNLIPNWGSCTTVAELESEFSNWAMTVCMQAYCKQTGLVYGTAEANKSYTNLYKLKPNLFYTVAFSNSNAVYYYGGDKELLKRLKTQTNALKEKKLNKRWSSFVEDSTNVIVQTRQSITGKDVYTKEQQAELLQIAEAFKSGQITEQQKQEKIAAFNQKNKTSVSANLSYSDLKKTAVQKTGGIVQEISNGKDFLEGNYVFSEAARKELYSIADRYEKGELTYYQKNDLIAAFNKQYGANISYESTAKTLRGAAEKKNGITHVTGNDIADQLKKTAKELSYASGIWDNSNNAIIKKLTTQGISGDVMWGVITGKYNKDDKCRQDLEAYAAAISNSKLTTEEKKQMLEKLKENYPELNLSDDVTPEEIAKIVQSNQEMTYKKKIKDIAGQILEDKLNQQIKENIESKLGCKLEDWGIVFNKNKDGTPQIIGTIRDIIRGNKNAFFREEKFIKKLQEELEHRIDKLIEEKVKKVLDEQIDQAAADLIDKIDPYRQKAEALETKLDIWINNPQSSKLEIANRLDELIKSPVDKIAGLLNKIDQGPLGKLGLKLGLGDMFKQITQVYTKGFAEKIYTITKPLVEKALTIVTAVKTAITRLIDVVNKVKEKAKQLVEQWKNKIKEVVKEATQKLVNELMKYVKLNISTNLSLSL